MVVQCPSCQSRFRVADEKVTDRGVRVRCTVCKNVFPVKKGAAPAEGDTAAKRPPTGPISGKQPGEGKRLDIDDLFGTDELVGEATGPLKGPKTGPITEPVNTGPLSKRGVAKPGTGPIAKPSTGPIPKPATGPISDAKPSTGPIGSARPPTGPLTRSGTGPIAASKPPTGPISKPSTGPVGAKPSTGPVAAKPSTGPVAAKPSTGPQRPRAGADDLDLDLGFDAPPPAAAPPASLDPSGLLLDEGADEPLHSPPGPAAAREDLFDMPPAAKDPFDSPPAPAAAKKDLVDSPRAPSGQRSAEAPPAREEKKEKKEPQYRSIFRNPAEPPRSTRRELISSALTGLVGASLAIVVMFVAALSDEHSGGWLGYGTRDDLVATRIASGVYDTASGRPVLFVRGRVENRGKSPRAIRVVAELVGDAGVTAKAETLAGSEPGTEDVYALSSAADAERLMRSLVSGGSDRALAPGRSFPFFAVFSEVPQDLQAQKLHVRFEPIEAAPRQRSAQRAR